MKTWKVIWWGERSGSRLVTAAVRVFVDVLAAAFVLEHAQEARKKRREVDDAAGKVADVVDVPREDD